MVNFFFFLACVFQILVYVVAFFCFVFSRNFFVSAEKNRISHETVNQANAYFVRVEVTPIVTEVICALIQAV